MNYSVQITKTAERDLLNAADYVEFSLKNPIAANNLIDAAEQKISVLSSFPEAYPIVDDPVLSAWGIRFLVINKYLAFYTIMGNTIFIVRFLYCKSDWVSILKQGYSLE